MNGIEKDVRGVADVVRLSLLSKFGRDIAARYEVTAAPTTIVVDGDGQITYQHSGLPNRETVVRHVTA